MEKKNNALGKNCLIKKKKKYVTPLQEDILMITRTKQKHCLLAKQYAMQCRCSYPVAPPLVWMQADTCLVMEAKKFQIIPCNLSDHNCCNWISRS